MTTLFDPKKNFAVSTVTVAPVPALTGTSLQIAAGEGSLFPAAGAGVAFNAIVFPGNAAPTVANAEIVRVTTRAGEVFTMTRTQEGSTARAIQVGDRIMEGYTVKTFTDIEAAINAAAGAVALAAAPVLEPGVAGQISRGRVLTLADFTMLGLAAPVGGWDLADLSDFSGNGRVLTNKGAVPVGSGIMGAALEAAVFSGSTAQALYIPDAGAGDPFRIPYGSIGCWFRTAKSGTAQTLVSKTAQASPNLGWLFFVASGNTLEFILSYAGTTNDDLIVGVTPVTDDRWHFGVVTYDGSALSLYVDGQLDAFGGAGTKPVFGAAAPLNIGGQSADGVTAATQPFFGRVEDAFVTQDVLSLEQVRMLYAAKVAHGFGAVPLSAKVGVRRLRKGAPIAAGIFSTAPLHLYNFTAGALTDAGSLGTALTNNGVAVVAPGADGAQGNAFNFVAASSQSLSATDAGLPSGTAARSYGGWFKAATQGATATILGWGTVGTNEARLLMNTNGTLVAVSGADAITTVSSYADGQWHFVSVTEDNAAADGLKRKIYIDGKIVGSSTVLNSITLVGANGLRIGANPGAASGFFSGQVDAPFVTGYAMGADEIAMLYAQGSQSLGVSPKNAGDHIEAMDATSVYLVADTLDSQNQIDLEVAA